MLGSVAAGGQSNAACTLCARRAIQHIQQRSCELKSSERAGARVTTAQERPEHKDFLRLQDQSASFSPEDRKDWLKACRFLRGALSKAGWQGIAPTDEEIMSYIGRIVSNNFG